LTENTILLKKSRQFQQTHFKKPHDGIGCLFSVQHQRTVEDYSEAVRFKPDYAEAYMNRGVIYLKQGNNTLGCQDAQKACALGNCITLISAKGMGFCR